jgi:hypothetical protein
MLNPSVFAVRVGSTDVFFMTLDRSDKAFSPTTSCHAYIVNDAPFHLESQSVTRSASDTGQMQPAVTAAECQHG